VVTFFTYEHTVLEDMVTFYSHMVIFDRGSFNSEYTGDPPERLHRNVWGDFLCISSNSGTRYFGGGTLEYVEIIAANLRE